MSLLTLPRQLAVDVNGAPRVGAKAYFYLPTTTTEITIYTTASYSTPHTNPVESLTGGLFPAVYVNPSVNATFKLVITDSADVQIYSDDNIPALGFTLSDVAFLLNPRTAAEIAAGVTPTSFALEENDRDRYSSPDNATMYLALLSDLRNGERIDLLRAVPKAEWAGIRNYVTSYDASDAIADVFDSMASAKRGNLYIPDGLWKLGSAITNCPLKMRISGSTRRGTGAGASTDRGTILLATQNTAAPFQVSQGSLTNADLLIEHLNLLGTGTGTNIDGFVFTNIIGITLRDLVVSNFTRRCISHVGGNYMVNENVYCSAAGEACWYIDSDHDTLFQCASDGGQYSVYVTALGQVLEICGRSHFEGPSIRCLHILGGRFKMIGGLLAPTIAATGGAYVNAASPAFVGTEMFHQNGGTSYGIESDTSATDYRYNALSVHGFSTGVILREGLGTLAGCTINGETTGLELVGGSYIGVITGNHIGGVTDSILHTSGNGKYKLSSNRLSDAVSPQTFKRMTVTAGYPLSVTDCFDTTPPTVASASSITLPMDTDLIYISGTTNITSINAAGHSGKVKRLYFLGALTVVDGSNLLLAGGANFVTTADDILTLTCDGTNWMECSRSAN